MCQGTLSACSAQYPCVPHSLLLCCNMFCRPHCLLAQVTARACCVLCLTPVSHFSPCCCTDALVLAVLLSSCAGDGAGMLCAMPDSFFSAVLMDEQSFKLPPLGDYAVGMVSSFSKHTAPRPVGYCSNAGQRSDGKLQDERCLRLRTLYRRHSCQLVGAQAANALDGTCSRHKGV